MAHIITMGEIMMRLSPPGNQRICQATNFDINFGGAEANVAVCLSMLGHKTEYVTMLPNNQLGTACESTLKKVGVGTDKIVRGGKRLGVYYFEYGSSVRPSSVVYDRSDSSFANSSVEDFDFEMIFKGADLFHICGITPALSEKTAEITIEAVKKAKEMNCTVSFDVNYRGKLWSVEQAAKVLPKIMPYVDICFANAWDANNLLGVDVSENAPFEEAAEKICEKYGVTYVGCSKRINNSATDNDYSGLLYSSNDKKLYTSKLYSVTPIVDRIGSGDSFASGVLCGILEGKTCQETVEFGTAAAVLKHTIPGDINYISKSEVEALSAGSGSSKVQR